MGKLKLPSSLEEVHFLLGLPADYVPATAEEAEFFYERAIDLLKAPTKSNYMCVTAAGKRSWQAKVTARGHQVILGNFHEPRRAAHAVLMYCIGAEPAPPSPDKALRNRKGEGRRPGSRHRVHKLKRSLAARVSPATVTAGLEREVSDTPPRQAGGGSGGGGSGGSGSGSGGGG